MNKRTIVQQFLLVLSDNQRGIVRDYFRILTDPSIPRKDVVNRISEIWSFAEEDPVLLSWLESIDFILSDEDDKNENYHNDKRAYLSEHLSTAVNLFEHTNHVLFTPSNNKLPECIAKDKSVSAILRCPDGNNHVVVTLNGSQLPCKGKPLSPQLCSECNFMLHEHEVIAVSSDIVAI
jgi:hypothetical protein